MNPLGAPVLHHRGHQRGARRVEHAFVDGMAQDLVVRRQQGLGEELAHVVELGLGHALEHRRDGLQCDLRRHLALGMPAHAVGEREQARLARVAVAHAVFVLLAAATAADLEYGELHLGFTPRSVASPSFCTFFLASETRVSSCKRIFSATVSLV
ncbi:hypothetical protein SDC9_164558 [bioreactor metagenome]|uniref:Uncharacterized protein n=1 Tax=bioreactor metagenome TaxID=1076179 RepID=A0A645FRX5_9ZZZZ